MANSKVKKPGTKSSKKVSTKGRAATKALTERQIAEIKRYWENKYELNRALAEFVPEDTRLKIEEQVLRDMKLEGKELLSEMKDSSGMPLYPGYADLYGGEFAIRIKEWAAGVAISNLDDYRDIILKAVCVDFEYCRKRQQRRMGESQALAISVADVLVTIWTGIPLPVTAITVYLIQNHVLDRWCSCPD